MSVCGFVFLRVHKGRLGCCWWVSVKMLTSQSAVAKLFRSTHEIKYKKNLLSYSQEVEDTVDIG